MGLQFGIFGGFDRVCISILVDEAGFRRVLFLQIWFGLQVEPTLDPLVEQTSMWAVTF